MTLEEMIKEAQSARGYRATNKQDAHALLPEVFHEKFDQLMKQVSKRTCTIHLIDHWNADYALRHRDGVLCHPRQFDLIVDGRRKLIYFSAYENMRIAQGYDLIEVHIYDRGEKQ